MCCHGDSVYRYVEWVTGKVGLLHWYPIFFNMLCKIVDAGSRQGVAAPNFDFFLQKQTVLFLSSVNDYYTAVCTVSYLGSDY